MQRKSLTVLSVKDVICTAVHQYISQVVVKLDFQVLSKLKETRFNQGLKKARLVRRTRNKVNDKSWPPSVPHKLAKMDFTLFSILNLKKTHLSSLHALSWIHNLNAWSAWAWPSTRHQYQSDPRPLAIQDQCSRWVDHQSVAYSPLTVGTSAISNLFMKDWEFFNSFASFQCHTLQYC